MTSKNICLKDDSNEHWSGTNSLYLLFYLCITVLENPPVRFWSGTEQKLQSTSDLKLVRSLKPPGILYCLSFSTTKSQLSWQWFWLLKK